MELKVVSVTILQGHVLKRIALFRSESRWGCGRTQADFTRVGRIALKTFLTFSTLHTIGIFPAFEVVRAKGRSSRAAALRHTGGSDGAGERQVVQTKGQILGSALHGQ